MYSRRPGDRLSSRYDRDSSRRGRATYSSRNRSEHNRRQSDPRDHVIRDRSPVSVQHPLSIPASGDLDRAFSTAFALSQASYATVSMILSGSGKTSQLTSDMILPGDQRGVGKQGKSSHDHNTRDMQRCLSKDVRANYRLDDFSRNLPRQTGERTSRDGRDTNNSLRRVHSSQSGERKSSHSASHFASRHFVERHTTRVNNESYTSAKEDGFQTCPVSGCSIRPKKLKDHVFGSHLPYFFHDRVSPEQLSDRSFHKKRADALSLLAYWILGSGQKIWDLVGLINRNKGVPQEYRILGSSVPAMRKLCQQQDWRVPQTFELNPINSPAALVHWRPLVYLLNHLNRSQKDAFQSLHHSGDIHRYLGNSDLQEISKTPLDLGTINLGARTENLLMGQFEPITLNGDNLLPGLVQDHQKMDITYTPDQQLLTANAMLPLLPALAHQTLADGVLGTGQPFSYGLAGLTPGSSSILDGMLHGTMPLSDRIMTSGMALKPESAGVSSTVDDVRNIGLLDSQKLKRDQPLLLPAIDSFYHLDKTAFKLWGSYANATTEDILRQGPKLAPGYAVNLVGGVQVFSDPDTYPEKVQAHKKWKVAIGIHPMKAHQLSDKNLGQLLRLLSNKDVTALGVIGLDRSAPFDTWVQQEKAFREVLQFSKEDRPIILHVRGQSNDPYASDVHARCLKQLQEMRPTSQAVHLHCFRGRKEQVIEWLSVFPNTYFGFTPKCQEFDAHQVEALRAVPTDRILIETNSPHRWQVSGSLVTTPAMVGSVAMIVANQGNYTCKDLLRFTTANARRLYSIEEIKE